MKVTIPIVGNSKLLSFLLYIISVFGSMLVLIGIFTTLTMITNGDFVGMLVGMSIIAVGVGIVRLPYLMYRYIVRYVNFFRLKKEVKEKGLEPYIASSVKNALKIYSTAPGKIALTYIKSLNPEAAEIIISKENPNKQYSKRKNIAISSVCLIVGIIMLGFVMIYNTYFAYTYIDIPIEYKQYEKNLPVDANVKMNISAAVPIGTKEEYLSNGSSKKIISTSLEGVYYYVIDDRETEGVVYIPFGTIENNPLQIDSLGLNRFDADNYNLDTPLQVYGCIGDTPNYEKSIDVSENQEYKGDIKGYIEQHSKQSDELNDWLSDYALLEVNSFTPLTQEVREGKGIGDEWILVGVVLSIMSVILRLKKRIDIDTD